MTIEQNFNNKNEKIEGLLKQREILQAQLKEIENELSTLEGKDSNVKPVRDENKLESGEVKFFGNKNNKTLEGELSNSSGASFKVFNINGNQAEYQYCGAIKNENWFESVAKITNSASDTLNDRKEIITIKPGIVIKNTEGKWEVKHPTEIKFIY